MRPSPSLFRDTVSVETYTGESSYGPIYGAAVSVFGKVSTFRQLVRNAAGEEVVSEATVYVRPADASSFTPESRITIDGRASVVLSVASCGRPGQTVITKVTCA